MVEQSPRPNSSTTVLTPEIILRNTLAALNTHGSEATKALYVQRDVHEYQRRLRARAGLIVVLPEIVRLSTRRLGTIFPEEALDRLDSFSAQANDALKTDITGFQLGSLLVPMGTRTEEPHLLERFVTQLYPSVTSKKE